MPELPEVETIRRQLAPAIEGRTVVAAERHPSAKFVEATEAVGTTIERLGRRGKYLIAALDDGRELIVHLGMTGSLRVIASPTAKGATGDPDGDAQPPGAAADPSGDPFVRAAWELDGGDRLVFRDVRRFGRIAVVPEGEYGRLPTLAHLGPEPFDDAFCGSHLWEAIRTSSRHLKTQLLSQRPVAGLGNIYADEALWSAGIHPADRRLSRRRADDLVIAVREALASGLRHGGTTLRDYVDADGGAGSNQHHLACYGRGGEPCERCGTELRRSVVDARTTTWCPQCQPRRG